MTRRTLPGALAGALLYFAFLIGASRAPSDQRAPTGPAELVADRL